MTPALPTYDDLKIIRYPDKMLREPCIDFDWDTDIHAVVDGFRATLDRVGGLALAANQVGIIQRFFVGAEGSGLPPIVIQPTITETHGDPEMVEEGCLSLPGVRVRTPRFKKVTVSHIVPDISNEHPSGVFTLKTYDGILAQAMQHEIEHLDGKFFLDFLPKNKRILLLTRRGSVRINT